MKSKRNYTVKKQVINNSIQIDEVGLANRLDFFADKLRKANKITLDSKMGSLLEDLVGYIIDDMIDIPVAGAESFVELE